MRGRAPFTWWCFPSRGATGCSRRASRCPPTTAKRRAAVIADVRPKTTFSFADGIKFDYEGNYGHEGDLKLKDLNKDGIEDIRIPNTFFYNCTYYDDNARKLCKKKNKRGYAYEKLEDRDYVWNPAERRFAPAGGVEKYNCRVPAQ